MYECCIFKYVSYLHIQDVHYDSITLCKGKFHINICLERGFITLKGTHDLYFELTKVFSISLSCLLLDGFHSCLFMYSCMLRGSVGNVSCLNINRNTLSYICNFVEQGIQWHALILHSLTSGGTVGLV